jgi:SAM-dependent methyltransferase
MAPGWGERHAYFEERARPVTEKMLELLDPSPGDAVLELAAGTGVVGFSAAALVGPTRRVIVSDFAGAMVEVATCRAAELGLDNVECRVLDAERLDLSDGSVGGVFRRWGYMLMADVAARASRDAPRAASRRAGGVRGLRRTRAEPVGRAPVARAPAARSHPAARSRRAGILALADRDRVRLRLTEAGFADPAIEEVAFGFRFA